MKETFGKGEYFIGDICYALDDKIYDNIWGKVHGYKNGCFNVDKSKFVVSGTAHGDGCFMGSDGVKYGVDAGVIGVVPSILFKKEDTSFHGGRLVKVKKELTFETDGKGLFRIVIDAKELITINTK
jgi:hypothetical protein